MKSPFNLLKCLFIEGGIEICTADIARTFIQPDGDVLNFISCGAYRNHPEKLIYHFENVKRSLFWIKISKFLFEKVVVFAPILWICSVLQYFDMRPISNLTWFGDSSAVTSSIISFSIGSFIVISKTLFIIAIRFYLKLKLLKL